MRQFSQKSTQKGARNSAEDSVCVLSTTGHSPTPAAGTSPGTSEASAQEELPRKDAALQAWVCRMCLGPSSEVRAREMVILPAEGVRLLRSCRRRWEVCTASEIMKKRTGSSPRLYKSLNTQLHRQRSIWSLHSLGWEKETPLMEKAGSW